MKVLLYSGLLYLAGVAIVLILQPSIMFTEEGIWKEFGIGRNSNTHTWLPFWLFAMVWALLSYIIVLILAGSGSLPGTGAATGAATEAVTEAATEAATSATEAESSLSPRFAIATSPDGGERTRAVPDHCERCTRPRRQVLRGQVGSAARAEQGGRGSAR